MGAQTAGIPGPGRERPVRNAGSLAEHRAGSQGKLRPDWIILAARASGVRGCQDAEELKGLGCPAVADRPLHQRLIRNCLVPGVESHLRILSAAWPRPPRCEGVPAGSSLH